MCNLSNRPTCACATGWKGPNCDIPKCECFAGDPELNYDCKLGEQRCASCASTREVDENKQCPEKRCQCNNGSGHIGFECPDSGYRCANCRDGYELVNSTCLLKCTCSNGVANQSLPCPVTVTSHCQKCDTGFFLNEESVCVSNDYSQC